MTWCNPQVGHPFCDDLLCIPCGPHRPWVDYRDALLRSERSAECDRRELTERAEAAERETDQALERVHEAEADRDRATDRANDYEQSDGRWRTAAQAACTGAVITPGVHAQPQHIRQLRTLSDKVTAERDEVLRELNPLKADVTPPEERERIVKRIQEQSRRPPIPFGAIPADARKLIPLDEALERVATVEHQRDKALARVEDVEGELDHARDERDQARRERDDFARALTQAQLSLDWWEARFARTTLGCGDPPPPLEETVIDKGGEKPAVPPERIVAELERELSLVANNLRAAIHRVVAEFSVGFQGGGPRPTPPPNLIIQEGSRERRTKEPG